MLITKEKDYDELVLMKARGAIEDEVFTRLSNKFRTELALLKSKMSGDGTIEKSRLEKIKNMFILSNDVAGIFKYGTYTEKYDTFMRIGSNLILKDKKLNINNTELVSKLVKWLAEAKAKNPRFEPKKWEANKDKTDVFTSVCPTLLRE